jgi:hypothetical protein
MAGLFSTPHKTKAPPLPPPQAIPELDEDEVKKSVRPRKSRRYTKITGELEPETKKKKLLG